MNVETLQRAFQEAGADLAGGSTNMAQDEILVTIDARLLPAVVQRLLSRDAFHHLSAITGQDDGESLTVLYHFWGDGGLTIRVGCDRQAPSLPTIEDLIPAAGWYEREVHELLGIDFQGSPDQRPLLLPDDWASEPPLLATSRPEDDRP